MEQRNPLAEINELTEKLAETEALITEAVQVARYQGLSWAKIAESLHCSRQAAQQRYGRAAEQHHFETAPLSDPAFDLLFQAPQVES